MDRKQIIDDCITMLLQFSRSNETGSSNVPDACQVLEQIALLQELKNLED